MKNIGLIIFVSILLIIICWLIYEAIAASKEWRNIKVGDTCYCTKESESWIRSLCTVVEKKKDYMTIKYEDGYMDIITYKDYMSRNDYEFEWIK